MTRYLPPDRDAIAREITGFDELRAALEREVNDFAQPVRLIHCDTHIARIDKPLLRADGRVIDHFTRLESFGHPDVHWVRVRVDPAASSVFSFTQEIATLGVMPR